MGKKRLICINCPIGCVLEVEIVNGVVCSVSGNLCKLGSNYAHQEAIMPLRTLTGNMKASGCRKPFSVKTDKPIPKEMLLACALELKRHRPIPPISMGEIIITDILGTGSNIIATNDLTI